MSSKDTLDFRLDKTHSISFKCNFLPGSQCQPCDRYIRVSCFEINRIKRTERACDLTGFRQAVACHEVSRLPLPIPNDLPWVGLTVPPVWAPCAHVLSDSPSVMPSDDSTSSFIIFELVNLSFLALSLFVFVTQRRRQARKARRP